MTEPTNAKLHRNGFTVIELLAASTLGMLLMVTLLGALGAVTSQHQALLRTRAPRPWQKRLAEQFRRDFMNSRQFRGERTELTLIGYAGRDFTTGVPTHRLTQIVYSVEDNGRRSWLMRRETHLQSRSNRNSRTQPACAGAVRLQVIDLDEIDPSERKDRSRKYRPIPNRLRLILHGDKSRVLLDGVFFIH